MAIGLLPALGAAGSLLGGLGANSAAKRAAGEQAAFGKRFRRQFDQASPLYMNALQYLAGRAGVGGAPMGAPVGAGGVSPGTAARMGMGAQQPGPDRYGQRGMLPQSALGVYGQGEDALRLNQADDQISQMLQQRQALLGNRLGRQGIGGSTAAAAMGGLDQDAFRQLAEFRRGLAINAGQEQERRVAQLLGGLGPALSMGGQAANIYGGLAQQYGNQAQGALGSLGQLAQMYYQNQMMRRAGDQGAVQGPYSVISPWAGGF